MALLFCDSADHYTNVSQKYPSVTDWQVGSGNGRFSTNALVCDGSSGTKILPYTLPSTKQTLIVGFAYLQITAVSNRTVIQFVDSGTVHITLITDTNNKFALYRGTAAGTLLGTGTTVISPNVYYWIEIRVKIDDSAGEYEVRINGVAEIGPTTGADTRNGASAQLTSVQWLSPGNITGGTRLDDIYICDTLGGAADTFLGEIRVQCLFPNGNGNSSQFIGSDLNSTDNYLLVDEAAPNSDTDYVEASGVGNKDTYTYGDLASTTGTVYGVQPIPFAKKTDTDTRKICSVARLSGTEEDSADKTLTTAYAYYPDVRMTKPGGGAWTISDVNSAEFGAKVTA